MDEHDAPIEETGPLGEDSELSLPESLRADLIGLHGAGGSPTEAVDRAVALAAAEHFGTGEAIGVRRRRIPAWRWGRLAAAASVALVAGVVLWGPGSTMPTPAEPRASRSVAQGPGSDPDLNRDSSVDVLDALILARAVDAGGELLDLTGDGATSAADVEALTERIVSLRRRG